jgi:uncharacterized protein YdeI (YjbR/CyaY-like superfamily)
MSARRGGAAPREDRPVAVDDHPQVEVTSRAGWRAWLEAFHATAAGAWVVTWKKTSGGPYVPYDHLVEEALCFGWVDSRGRGLDAQRTSMLYTPRQAKSPWSASNRARVQRLTAEGLMREAGLAAVAAAKADGRWGAPVDEDPGSWS